VENVTGILIVCPASNQAMTTPTAQSLYWLAQKLTEANIPNSMTCMSIAGIVDARTLLLTKWYDNHPEYSHLLMVDADMQFVPTLIGDMLAFGKPLTGAFYPRREVPMSIIGRVLNDHNEVVNGFMKVKDVGAGVLLISREVVDVMLEKMPEVSQLRAGRLLEAVGVKRVIRAWDECDGDDGEHLSEDYAFCYRWRKCGGEVWANVRHQIGHVGPFTYTIGRLTGGAAERYVDLLEADKAVKLDSPAPLWEDQKANKDTEGLYKKLWGKDYPGKLLEAAE